MDNPIWQAIGNAFLAVLTAILILLFKRPASEGQKALLIGGVVFLATIFFNVIGFVKVSDYLAILGFVIITFALIRSFWSESKDVE